MLKFNESYDECMGEWYLDTTVGTSHYEMLLMELVDEEDMDTGEWYLASLENTGCKGQGHGATVLNHLKEWVRDKGGVSISLTPGGEGLHSFYSRCGWVPTGEFSWVCTL